MEILDMIQQAITSFAADVLFGAIMLLSFGLVLLALLFFLLAVRGVFRWLTRGSWNDVVSFTERKALK
jgi:hypothetical protein